MPYKLYKLKARLGLAAIQMQCFAISLTALVKQNLTRPPDLPIAMSSAQRAATPTRPNLQKAVMRKMEDGNVGGAVRLLSSEDAIAQPSAEVLHALQSKHPAADPDALYPSDPTITQPESPPVTSDEIFFAVSSLPNGSAGGIDGMLPQHIKDALSSQNGDTATRRTSGHHDSREGVCGYLPAVVWRMPHGPDQEGWRDSTDCSWRHIPPFSY